MARTAKVPVKSAEVPMDDGTVFMDFPKHCWAHVPSDDPKTWYLRMYWEPGDAKPDSECLMHAVEALKRADISRSQTNLRRNEIPYAKGRIRKAWREVLPNRDIPEVLMKDVIEPDETSEESEG